MKKNIGLVLVWFILCSLFAVESRSQSLVVKNGSTIIETNDGEPFLWIGDTAWQLFHNLNSEESVYYLDNREEKGFSVIQAVILPMGPVGRPNQYGESAFVENNPSKPNEAYFEHIDFIVDEVAKRGMHMGLLPTWANNVVDHNGEGAFFDTESAQEYGRFLGTRYKDKPVVWILGGDRNVQTDTEFSIWNAMAKGLQEGDNGNNLISYHPTAPISSHYWFHNKPWLAFNILQSGHFKKYQTEVYEYAEVFQQLSPLKPFVNAEPAYEDIAVLFWHYNDYSEYGKEKEDVIGEDGLIKDKEYFADGFFTDHDIRMEAYWTYLSGGAGYTYGNNAVWQMYKQGGNYAVPALTFWKEGLDRPGADDMRHIQKLFTRYPLGSFHVDQSVIHGINFTDENNIRAVVGNDNSFLLLYLNKGQNVKVNMMKLAAPGTAYWFNPREGSIEKIDDVKNEGIQLFDPPGEYEQPGNDWILILEAN